MNLRNIRKAIGLTQKQVAALAHTSEAEISLVESGKRNPSLRILKQLATALGVSVNELVGEDDEQCQSAS